MPNDPAADAAQLLCRFGFTRPPVNPNIILLDHMPVLEVSLMDWPEELSGMMVRGVKQSGIGINRNMARGRQNFTLWHEYYHWWRHQGASFLDRAGFMGIRHRIEWEANRFAACLLMPEDWVRAAQPWYNDARQLADSFHVSGQAMAIRLRELGLAHAETDLLVATFEK